MAIFNIEGYNSYSGCDIIVTASLPLIDGEAIGKYYTLGSIQTLSISTHQDKRPVRSLGVINAKDYVMGPRTIAGSMVFAVFNKHFASEIMADLGAGTGTEVILPDEIPALDITISFANEYGRMSRMAIYGVKLINEGQVMSINDLYTENTYQFVALGLEPITDEGIVEGPTWNGSKIPSPTQYTYYRAPYPEQEEIEKNAGVKLANQIKNNSGLTVKNLLNQDPESEHYVNNVLNSNIAIELSVESSDAASELDLGLAVFTLKPVQTNGTISIYIGTEKTSTPDYTLNVVKSLTHNMFLPVGTYTAQYMDLGGNTSNIVNFTIGIKKAQESISNEGVYPHIDKVTYESITASNNDNRFDTINIFETGGVLQSYDIGKTPITITDLKSDTEYNLFTSDSASSDKSQIISVKTFDVPNKDLDLLKEYVRTNNNLFIGNCEDILAQLDNIDLNEFDTLIDAVLSLPDSKDREELLIYTSFLTNQLIDSYNVSNPNSIKHSIQNNPFSNTITVEDYNEAAVYANVNRKKALNKLFSTLGDEFYGTPDRHYSVYGLDDERNKSVKKDFVILKNTYLEHLKEYMNTEMYKELDLDYYKEQYKKYSIDLIQAMAIMDNCCCNLDLLEPPYVYQDNNGIVWADVKYDFLNKDNKYYLVCTDLFRALDSVPFRKIPIEFNTNILNLNNYYLGLLKGNNYLFWIEDTNFARISKPYIFRYHSSPSVQDEFDQVHKDEIYSLINKTQANMTANKNSNIVKDLFSYIYDLRPQKKNFNEVSATELINAYINSIYEYVTLNALFDLLDVNHQENRLEVPFKIIIDKTSKCIKVETLENFYICAINYNEDGSKRVLESDDVVFYGYDGYVMIYLMSETMIYKTGFILIETKTNKYMCSEELLFNIKEGAI